MFGKFLREISTENDGPWKNATKSDPCRAPLWYILRVFVSQKKVHEILDW